MNALTECHRITEYTCTICRRIKQLFSARPRFDLDEQRDCFAQSLPRATFILWLANETARDLLRAYPLDIEAIIIAIDGDDTERYQRDAERYLRYQYSIFDYTWRRRIIIFRRLVQHKLRVATRN